jgi:hypothetical protein
MERKPTPAKPQPKVNPPMIELRVSGTTTGHIPPATGETDMTPRYVPERTIVGVREATKEAGQPAGYNAPIVRIVAHGPGSDRAGVPTWIRPEMVAVEMVTAKGTRWQGVVNAYIDGSLRMVVEGINPRDEVLRNQWVPVPADEGPATPSDPDSEMSDREACDYAAGWADDRYPGSTLYNLPGYPAFAVESEEQRAIVIDYMEGEIAGIVAAHPASYDANEAAKVAQFVRKVHAAPIMSHNPAPVAIERDDSEEWEGPELDADKQAEAGAIVAELDDFAEAYIEAALFNGVEAPEGHPMADTDKLYDRPMIEIDPATLRDMIADCRRFLTPENVAAIEAAAEIGIRDTGATPMAQAGHDFWFTRNGAGVGFWEDSDWPKPYGDILDKAAKRFGETGLYVGDDGHIYQE